MSHNFFQKIENVEYYNFYKFIISTWINEINSDFSDREIEYNIIFDSMDESGK